MPELTPERLVVSLIAVGIILLVSFPVHEFSHALMAYRLGDSTARYMGRLTLDPRRHIDPLGAGALLITALVGFGIGWAKPTPVNPLNLRGGRRGEALVAAAGPISNLIIAGIAAIPARIIWGVPDLRAAVLSSGAGPSPGSLIFLVLLTFIGINVVLFVFNLIPIPPFDGWAVLRGLAGPRLAYDLRRYEPVLAQYGLLILLLVLFVSGGRILGPIVNALVGLLTGVPLL